MRARTRTNLLLLLAWLVLVGGFAYQALNPPHLEPGLASGVDTAAPEIEVQPFQPPRIATLEFYSETVERPVFYPDRRPPEPEAEIVVQAPPPPPEPEVELSLVGIFLTDRSTMALILQHDTNRVARLNLGEEVANWRLEQVASQSVTLSRGEQTRELALLRNQRAPRPVRTRDPRGPMTRQGQLEVIDGTETDEEGIDSPEIDPRQLIEQLLQYQQSS